jgi:hypothetical protein
METYVEKHLDEIHALMMGRAWRHGCRNNTRVVSQRGSKSRAYPMEKPMKWRPLRGLCLAHPPKSPRGKGMTSMDTGSTQKRRTRRARYKIAVFDMRASTSPRGRGGNTMGRLKRYENLTTAVNYIYPSSDASGLNQRGLSWMTMGYKDDQWVLATEVMQVAYYVMAEDNRRHVVVLGKQRIVGADGV